MIRGIIGTKIGMTGIFLDDGTVLPATVVNAGPCFVVDKKLKGKDGYDAIQLGYAEVKPQRVTKPLQGHFRRAGVPPLRVLHEFEGEIDKYKPGDIVGVDVFKDGDIIDVTGTSKGKGFAGVMKRHGFSGQPDSHGGNAHRRPGSIGQASYPARVWKGMKMPGHMGSKMVTVQGLEVTKIEAEKNVIIIKGSVPGPNGGIVILRHTTKGRERSA